MCLKTDCFLLLFLVQQMGGGGGPMQPGQVPPNQNFLNRAPGSIPVSHGNVQQQVNEAPLSAHASPACFSSSLCLLTAPGTPDCMPYWTTALFSAVTAPPSLLHPSSSSLLHLPSPGTCSVLRPVCGGGHAPCQSGLSNGGAAEAEQHGENKFLTLNMILPVVDQKVFSWYFSLLKIKANPFFYSPLITFQLPSYYI